MIYSENIFICIAIPLFVIFPFIKGGSKRFCIALVSGMFMCLLGAYLNSFFGMLFEMNETETARYISPIVEELMRLLPILVYFLLVLPKEESLMHFAIGVGAGFATFENCCYITMNDEVLIRFVLIRGLAVGIMHVVCGIIVGMGLIILKKYKGFLITGTIGCFAFSMTIHALYNLLVSADDRIAVYIGFVFPISMVIIVFIVYRSHWIRLIESEQGNTSKQGNE